jgi:hypothetical protein
MPTTLELLGRPTLERLLDCKFETEVLDYKVTYDLPSKKGAHELAKDVMAMSNTRGGFIVVGVEDKSFRLVGLRTDEADLLANTAGINKMIAKAVGNQITVHTATHNIEQGGTEVTIGLIVVKPGTSIVLASVDGNYPVPGGKTDKVFSERDIFVRKADQSTKAASPEDLTPPSGDVGPMLAFARGAVRAAPAAELPVAAFRNPYNIAVSARPTTFKGREKEIAEILDNVENGVHTAVFGLQRMGKTSLVEYALTKATDAVPSLRDGIVFARINLQELGEQHGTYKNVLQAIIRALSEAHGVETDADAVTRLIDDVFETSKSYSVGDTPRMLEGYRRIIEMIVMRSNKKIVLFLDEFSELCRIIELNKNLSREKPRRGTEMRAHEMFIDISFMHFLSTLLKNERIYDRLVFIFAVRPFVADYDNERGLQVLKLTMPVYIYYLDEASANALISDPVSGFCDFEPGAADYLTRLTAGHPYFIQFFMQKAVDKLKKERRSRVDIADLQNIAHEMVEQSAAFSAHFKVLDTDYSVDELIDPRTGLLGKGTLALIAELGKENPDGWVREADIRREIAKFGIGASTVDRLLSMLLASKITVQRNMGNVLDVRIHVPLLRQRYLATSKYARCFGNAIVPKK